MKMSPSINAHMGNPSLSHGFRIPGNNARFSALQSIRHDASAASTINGTVESTPLLSLPSRIMRIRDVIGMFGLDEIEARYFTNMAIKSFTDPTAFHSFDDEGNSLLMYDENGHPMRDENGTKISLGNKYSDRKSTRLNSSHPTTSRMPSSA